MPLLLSLYKQSQGLLEVGATGLYFKFKERWGLENGVVECRYPGK